MPVRVDILYENSSFNTGKADLGPRSYSIQGFSGRFTNRNRTDYLKTPESNIYKRQGEEDNDQCPQNDCDPPMIDSTLDTSTMDTNMAQACRNYPLSLMHKNI